MNRRLLLNIPDTLEFIAGYRELNRDTVLLRCLFKHTLLSPNMPLRELCSSTLHQIYMPYVPRSWDKLAGIWERPQMKYSWTFITFITILWFSLLGRTTTLSSSLLNQPTNFINHQINDMNLSHLNVLSGLQKYLSTWQSHTTYETICCHSSTLIFLGKLWLY